MCEAIEQLQAEFRSICAAIGSPYKFHIVPQDDGSAHIEYASGSYSYVITERGIEYERRVTQIRHEILYWLTSDAVFTIACQFERNNRIPGQDVRRLIFAKELDLLSLVNPAWAERKNRELETILAKHPYVDPVAG